MATKKPLSVEEGVKLNKKDSAVTYNTRNEGMVYNNNNTEVNVQIGGADRALVTKDQTQTLTNKTINADNNTVSNLEVDNLKAGVLDTDLSSVSLSDDTIPSAKATKSYADTTVSTHNSLTAAHGVTGAIVGTTDSQSLTNKTIDSDLNTITNIVNADIKVGAAIDATKIHNGSVNNDEFGYLDGVTSSIQSQLNARALDSAVVHNTGNENVAGVKTFTDTTESTTKDTGAVIIEGGLGVEKNLNVGGNIVVTGNLQVDGTYTAVNSTSMEVTDPNIILNNGGNQASANSATAGFTVEMSDATDAVFGYDSTLASKFKCGETGALKEVVDVSSIQSLTNKTLSGASIESPVRADVKKDTLANLTTYALTASNGQLVYATDEDKMYQIVDNELTEVGGGGVGNTSTWAIIADIGDIDTGNSNIVGGATVTESLDTIIYTTGTTAGAYYVSIGYTPEKIIQDKNFFRFLYSASTTSEFTLVAQGYTGAVWEDIGTTPVTIDEADRVWGLIGFDKGTYTQFRIKLTQSGTTAGRTFTLSRGEWTDRFSEVYGTSQAYPTVEKILPSDVGTAGDIASLTFTGLEIGKEYELTGQVEIFGYNNQTSGITFRSGPSNTGTIYGNTKLNSERADLLTRTNYAASFKFTAVSSSLYAYKYGVNTVYGNGTKENTFLQLTRKPDSDLGYVYQADFDRSEFEWPSYDISSYITGGTPSKAEAVYYKTADGKHRLVGNLQVTTASGTARSITILGVTFAGPIGYYQAISVDMSGGNWCKGVTVPLTGQLDFYSGLASTEWRISFNVELASKPTWATKSVKPFPMNIVGPVAVANYVSAELTGYAGGASGTGGILQFSSASNQLPDYLEISANKDRVTFKRAVKNVTAQGNYACTTVVALAPILRLYNSSGVVRFEDFDAQTVTQSESKGVTLLFDANEGDYILLYKGTSAGTPLNSDATRLFVKCLDIDSALIASPAKDAHKNATYLSSTETEAGWCEFTGKQIYKRTIYFPTTVTTSNSSYVYIGTGLTPVNIVEAQLNFWVLREYIDTSANYSIVAFNKTTGYILTSIAGASMRVGAGTRLVFEYTKD